MLIDQIVEINEEIYQAKKSVERNGVGQSRLQSLEEERDAKWRRLSEETQEELEAMFE